MVELLFDVENTWSKMWSSCGHLDHFQGEKSTFRFSREKEENLEIPANIFLRNPWGEERTGVGRIIHLNTTYRIDLELEAAGDRPTNPHELAEEG